MTTSTINWKFKAKPPISRTAKAIEINFDSLPEFGIAEHRFPLTGIRSPSSTTTSTPTLRSKLMEKTSSPKRPQTSSSSESRG